MKEKLSVVSIALHREFGKEKEKKKKIPTETAYMEIPKD